MRFGIVFGALFFGLVCSGVGVRFLANPLAPSKTAGLSLIVLGGSLAAGSKPTLGTFHKLL